MKKMILFLVVMVSINANTVIVHNNVNYSYTPFLYAVAEDLEIPDSTVIYLSSTNIEVTAFVTNNGFGGYTIHMNFNRCEDRLEVMAHELVHIKQDIEGRWDVNNPTTIVTHYGKKYVSEKAKEIEREAMRLGRKLRWKHRKTYR